MSTPTTPYVCPVCQRTYEGDQPRLRVAVPTEAGPVLQSHTFYDACAMKGCCPPCARHIDTGTGEFIGCPDATCLTCGDTAHGAVMTPSKGGRA